LGTLHLACEFDRVLWFFELFCFSEDEHSCPKKRAHRPDLGVLSTESINGA